jgi:hypothetical protein
MSGTPHETRNRTITGQDPRLLAHAGRGLTGLEFHPKPIGLVHGAFAPTGTIRCEGSAS